MLTTTPSTALFPAHPDDRLQSILVPAVVTSATPPAAYLLATRKEVEKSPEANALLAQFHDLELTFDELTQKLSADLCQRMHAPASMTQGEAVDHMVAVHDSARYLAAETSQIPKGILITSKVTGKVIACLNESHFWQPPMTSREDGTMATAMLRLRPDVEAFLVHHVAEEGRFEEVLEVWHDRLPKGASVPALVTPQGRKGVVEALRGRLRFLLGQASGASGLLLSLIKAQPTIDTENYVYLGDITLVADQVLRVPDALSPGLGFDPEAALAAKVAVAWGRSLASFLVEQAHLDALPPNVFETNPDASVLCYLAPPDEAAHLRASTGRPVLVTDAGAPLAITNAWAGAFVPDPDSYRIEGRELHERWEVRAVVKGALYVHPSSFRRLDLGDVPVTGVSVELV